MIVSILQDLMSFNKQEIIVGVKDNRSKLIQGIDTISNTNFEVKEVPNIIITNCS